MGIASPVTPGVIGTTVIDVGMNLSKVNHRLYRQGMNYCVKLDFDADDKIETSGYKVFALTDTWMTHTAWKKGFEAFLNNSAEEDEAKARWYDFRVRHGWNAGGVAEGLPVQYNGNSITPSLLTEGEHAMSQVNDDAGNIYNFTFAGGSAPGNLSLIEELDKQHVPIRESGQQLADRAYSVLNAEISEPQFDHLKNDGDAPPYDFWSLEQQHPWKLVADIQPASNGRVQSTGYFNAPCGFVVVVGYFVEAEETDLESTKIMRLTAKAGKYKGVHATPMGEPVREGAKTWRVR